MNIEQSGRLWQALYAIHMETGEDLDPGALDFLLMRGYTQHDDLTGTGYRPTDKGLAAFAHMEAGKETSHELDADEYREALGA